MAAPQRNDILPASVERGHVRIVFESEPTTVEPSTPSASHPSGAITAPDRRETDAMAELLTAANEEEDEMDAITTPPFREIVTHESPRVRNLMMLNKLEGKFDDGYDSDGECGPFFDLEDVEGLQIFDEEVMMERTEDDTNNNNEEGTVDETNNQQEAERIVEADDRHVDVVDTVEPQHVPISDDTLAKFSREEIKEQLRIRRQKLGGNKQQMLDRLKKALEEKVAVVGAAPKSQPKKKKAKGRSDGEKGMGAFPDTAYWRVLNPDSEPTQEPSNPTFNNPRAPTVVERDAKYVPVKYNFSSYKFQVPIFSAFVERVSRWANGREKKDKDGKTLTEKTERETGCVNPKAIKKYKLTTETRPEEYAEIVLPFHKNVQGGKQRLSFRQLKDWTNTKASLADAGKEGTCYRDFKDFSTNEIRQHLGLYVLQGLCPSPRVEMKFHSQQDDKVHGNDFVYRSFGANAERRHRHFKAFFACQDPRIDPPPRNQEPNWKIRPLLMWMNFIFPALWMLAVAFSVDEMTMGFKGQHTDKKRITYKAEGDGFQADALCQDGFTYQVFMRNDSTPTKYLKQGLSPLHSRVMGLFDTVKETHHQCAMDNLYNSAAFCKAAFQHDKKVLCHGVTRMGMRGIPKHVEQKEVKNRKEQLAVRGTVKAAVLEGDPNCPNLVASSVYDAKPVHYLSMVSNEIKWTEIKKNVYNVDSGEVEELKFLRLNNIDKYNKEMGNVDLADQLRGTYRLDKSTRNRKWWWSIMFWSVGVMLTNAYIMYLKVNMLEYGVQRKYLMSHHDFRKAIALYWINPEEYEKELKVAAQSYKLKRKSTSSSVSSISIDSSIQEPTKKIKTGQHYVTDMSLCPSSGSLKCRLDQNLDHIPEAGAPRARCWLHWWGGVETQAQILVCLACGVSLCSKCYRLFHTKPNIVSMKSKLMKRFKK